MWARCVWLTHLFVLDNNVGLSLSLGSLSQQIIRRNDLSLESKHFSIRRLLLQMPVLVVIYMYHQLTLKLKV